MGATKMLRLIGRGKVTGTEIYFVVFCAVLATALLLIPSGFEGARDRRGVPAKALVVDVDNTTLQTIGLIWTGEQGLRLLIMNGRYRGEEVEAVNHFLGRLELDRMYTPGDRVYTVLEILKGKIHYANIIDYYRINYEIVLLAVFFLFLIAFAGWTGVKAMLSFVCAALIIWKVLLPGFLKGYDPILFSLGLTSAFTAVIVFLVGGLTKKGVTAMDVSASMKEVIEKKPGIPRAELVRSGFSVGRAVIGTMTTTLLLAYSGGYTFLLMVFIVQGIPMGNILNLQYVSAEILHTVVGSFGLVAVAPFTALVGGLKYAQRRGPEKGRGKD